MSLWSSRGAGLAVVVIASLGVGFCGGGGSAGNAPTQPTVPAPAPTPAPTSTPDPPLSASCAKLPAGNPNAACQQEPPDFQEQVDAAIRALQAEQPGLFNGNTVLSVGAYYVGLIKILDRLGLCAETDGGEEMGVARSSGYHEQYDVLTSRNEVRFGPASYRTTCSPSSVPRALGPLPPTVAGCSLPASRAVACGREEAGRYYSAVDAAIGQILKEKPELFDFGDTAAGTDFPAVRDMTAYTNGVVSILQANGFCALTDGEEMGVKTGSNVVSEQYDINLADRWVRRGPNTYRVSCYPAAF